MLRERIKYSAAETKVYAMYGKLISEEEWKRLYECSSLSEVLTILHGQKGWSSCFAGLSQLPDAQELKVLAGKKVLNDYEKLYRFLGSKDKVFVRLFLAGVENSLIMSTLRALHTQTTADLSNHATDFLKTNCSIDLDALEKAEDYGQLLKAVENSIFYADLKALPIVPQTGLPKYRDSGVVLENRYYTAVFSYIVNKYDSQGKKMLAELVGTKADLMNLVSILRLRRYFPASVGNARELLIPVSLRLKSSFVREMLDAKTEEELYRLIMLTPYAKQFAGYENKKLDGMYDKAVGALCRRLLRIPKPGLVTVIAYFVLSELESAKLLGLIEAVGYGIKLGKA